jgi:hypothetical protein
MASTFKDSMQSLRRDLEEARAGRLAFAESLKIWVSEVRSDAHNILDKIRINREEAHYRRMEVREQLRVSLSEVAQRRRLMGDDLQAGSRAFHARDK